MAAHLQDLTLSSEGSAFSAPFINPHLPTVLPGERSSSPYPHHLNIKTVASCPQSIESQENRKREPLDLECCLNEDCMDVLMIPSRKRTRVDVGSAETCMSSCVNFKSDTKAMHLSSNHHDGDSMSASLHGIGSLSDLSSIPEEGELTQHTSMTTDTTDTSNSIADSPDSSDTQEDKLNPNSHPTMPISISSLLPSSQSAPAQGDKVCSVWLAPELKAGIKTHIDSPLPLSILKEM